jgi:VWFA-related protein
LNKQFNKILSGVAIFMAVTVITAIAFYFIRIMMESERNVEGFSFSPVGYVSVGFYNEKLAPMKMYDLWGYCDNHGKVQIVPQYTMAGEFSYGLAAVQESKSGMYGYIDSSGKYIIQPQFSYAGSFSEELAACGSKSDKKLGYIDMSGEFVIPEKYYEAAAFSEGLAKVRTASDGLYSFIDRNDNVVIPASYTAATDFSQGLSAVSVNGLWGYIDKNGNMVIQPGFTRARAFHENLAAVQLNGTWGYIDQKGSFVIKNIFSEAEDFSGGYAPVKFNDNGLWGYINNKGEIAIDGSYQQVTGFTDGVAAVRENSKWLFVTDINYKSVVSEQSDSTQVSNNKGASETISNKEPETISNKNIMNLIKQIQLYVNESVQLSGTIKTKEVIEKLVLNVIGEDGEDKGIYLSVRPGVNTYNLEEISIDGRIEPFNVVGKYTLQLIAKLERAEDEKLLGEVNVEVLEAEESNNLTAEIGRVDNSAYPIINLFMSVFDHEKKPVSKLTLENFELFETVEGQKEKKQELELVKQPSEEEGLTVALVFDCSLSMYNEDKTEANSNMEFAKNAAVDFINAGGVGAKDKVSIQSFGKAFKINQEFTESQKKLVKAINGIKSQPDTAIYDAIVRSVDTLSEQEGNKCIILFTDGEDTASKLKYNDSIESAVLKGIPVYSIAIGQEAKTNELKSISDKTGGTFYYLVNAEELNDIYKGITEKLKNQYQFTYKTTADAIVGKNTEIKMVVTDSNERLEIKKTYEIMNEMKE